MKKSTIFWLCSAMILLGTVLGFLLSPAKKGLYIGNNNGNTGGRGEDFNDDWDTEADDEDDMPF